MSACARASLLTCKPDAFCSLGRLPHKLGGLAMQTGVATHAWWHARGEARARLQPRRGEKVKTTTGGARRLACDANGPQVSIIMGSDSDWPTMEPAAQVLTDFNVGFEADVVSAHRMPEDMIEFGRGAHKRGIKVIIAGASAYPFVGSTVGCRY